MSNDIEIFSELRESLKNCNGNKDKVSEVLDIFAKDFLNNYSLFIKNQEIELCDIEFYFMGYGHMDSYVHTNALQRTSGNLYVHNKSINRGGIDITFGDSDCFGGFLIKGIKLSGDYITKPTLCKYFIAYEFDNKDSWIAKNNMPTWYNLQELIDANRHVFNISKSANIKNEIVRKTARVGLSSNSDTIKYHDKEYKDLNYRYVRNDYINSKPIDFNDKGEKMIKIIDGKDKLNNSSII